MTTKEKPENFNPSMRVGGIIFRFEDEILLFKRASHKKFGAGQWALCAGAMEEGEQYEDGVVREVFEETGIIISKEDLRHVGIYYHSPEVDRTFEIEWSIFETRLNHKPEIVINDEHSEYAWVEINDTLTYNLIDGEQFCLQDYLNN